MERTMRIRVVPILLLTVVVAAPAQGDLITIAPSRDNTIYEDPAGLLSNGAGPSLFSGQNTGSLARRALLHFDVAGAIPAGSTVTAATLTLHMSQGNSPVTMHALRRAMADWGEGASVASGSGGGGGAAQNGDATWLHAFYPSTTWAIPGGDFSSNTSASAAIAGPGFYSWSSLTLTADVQAMLNAPTLNFGWFLLGDESAASTAKRFDSREHADPLVRPSLTIEYIPVPAPGAALPLAGFILAFRRSRRADFRSRRCAALTPSGTDT
jgi:hypothetical protein